MHRLQFQPGQDRMLEEPYSAPSATLCMMLYHHAAELITRFLFDDNNNDNSYFDGPRGLIVFDVVTRAKAEAAGIVHTSVSHSLDWDTRLGTQIIIGSR
jgi:hypothetical protein